MSYNSIFNTKANKDNRLAFCRRIVDILNDIHAIVNNMGDKGFNMLNMVFRACDFNNGYYTISDLLKEKDKAYRTIYEATFENLVISDDEILSNIDIIINVINYGREKGHINNNYNKEITLLQKATTEYLLSMGLKLVRQDDMIHIVDSDVTIDIEEITDKSIADDALNYYDYKADNNVDEKRKILTNLLIKLENRRTDIEKILGKHISEALFIYANNFNLRHCNVDIKLRSYYNEAIANLTDNEFIAWYNYIYSFAINIYQKINAVKSVNIESNFKM